METAEREALAEQGQATADVLAEAGIHAVALTWVDNVGVTRVKAVPVAKLAHAAAWGVGMSAVHDVFCIDDSITTSRYIGGPVGDLRLHPDLAAVTILAAQPGWAWAPVDRWTQDGVPYPADQRGFARRMLRLARSAGLEPRMAFEIEWYLARPDGAPASDGPAYGMTRLVDLSDYGRDLLAALSAQGVPAEQFHPEYAPGQFELSVAPADPVTAADRAVLVRETIRAISLRHGLRASFAPVPIADAVGNGMHLHFSATTEQRNIFTGGDGPHGLTEPGESILAGVLARLPALSGLGAPSVSSQLRRVPQRWAGIYQCWGLENREASLRLVQGVVGVRDTAANVELKCVDASANPYLVVGAVCAVAAQSAAAGLRLPAEVTVDPATLPPDQQPHRLPDSVPAGIAALSADAGLAEALGPELLDAFRAVHQAEWEQSEGRSADEITQAVRWRY
ncbi:MAG: glutamine synthetase [Micromonosporaceae bacterium]|jgi:glutamine synthetase|nr:glutamine synthetase [Micromonosporaceae bacterium]